jgi:hypothetical protein
VEAVAGELVGCHVVAQVTGLGGLVEQIFDEVAQSLLRALDMFAAVEQRGEFAAVVPRRVALNLRVGLQDGFQTYDGRVGWIGDGGEPVEMRGDLTFHIEATDEDGLHQIRDVITRDFERFSRRDPVTVTWHQPETPDTTPRPEGGGMTPRHGRGPGRARLQTILLAVAVVLIIGLHLGLAGIIAGDSPWTGIATNVVLALVVLKVALIALARFGIRRRTATKIPDET